MPGFHFRHFYTKVQKSLASLVSFGRFVKTGISSSESGRRFPAQECPPVKRVVRGGYVYLLYMGLPPS